jgi:hypothetical protein
VRSSSSSFQGEESCISSSWRPRPPPKVFCNFFQMTVNQSHACRNAMACSLLLPPDYAPSSPHRPICMVQKSNKSTSKMPSHQYNTESSARYNQSANLSMYLCRLPPSPTHCDNYPPTATTNAPFPPLSRATS